MNTNGGNLRRVFTHNSGLRRREKVKRLSEETMSSNAEDNLHRRKFKGLCDSIPVHPASVPRKLRSAISKRSPRSASVPTMDSKRLKHSINGGVASLRADYLKKMKANMQYVSEPLSKEEEEVAETLFALAGMITSDGESSKAKTPECTGNHDDPMSSSKDVVIRKEEPETACNQSTSNADAVPVGDGPERDSILGKATSGTSPINWPNLSEKRQLNQALNVSAHPQRMPPLRACDEKVVVNCCTSSQLSNDAIRHTSVSDSKTEKASFTLLQSQHFVDSQAVDKVSSHERSSATVFPSWANAPASSSRSDACGNKLATDKVSSCVNGSMESRKRSMTHVFISHLIQGLETSTGKDNQPLNACQLLPSQSSSIPPNNNDLNRALTTHMVGSTTYENMCETGDRVPIVLEHHEGEEDGLMKKNFTFLSLTRGVGLQANSEAKGQVSHLHSVSQASASLPGSTSTTCLTSKAYRDQAAVGSLAMPRVLPQMQLQMPQYFAGTFNAAHMSQTGTGKPAQIAQPNLQQQNLQQQQVQLPRQQQLQLPQQHQHQHQHQHLQQQQLQFPPPQQHLQQQPLQLPQLQQQHNQNLHSQQLQLQHPQHHQQQQQQQKWTSQLPAQFRPGPLLPSHIQNWQNHKHDFRISTQAWPTSCQPSREMIGPKFFHIPQHSQQLIERCPPVPLSSTKPQPGQLPAVCENKGGRFQPDGALPFQLLCNKQ